MPLIGDIELFAQARAEPAAAQGGRHHRHQRQVDHHRARPPHPRDRRRADRDGRQYRPADPRPGPAAGRRRLCARAVELPARPDPQPRLRRRRAAQHHARPSRPLCRFRRLCGLEARGCSRCSRPGRAAIVGDEQSVDVGPVAAGRRCKGPHNAQNAARGDRRVRSARACRRRRSPRASPPIPACRTGWSGCARRTASCSSTTARRPTRIRPRRRSPPIRYVHWIVGGLAKTEDLGPCAAQLGHVRAAYTIGEAGPMFAQAARGQGAGAASRNCW